VEVYWEDPIGPAALSAGARTFPAAPHDAQGGAAVTKSAGLGNKPGERIFQDLSVPFLGHASQYAQRPDQALE
jgi:hypothetical protein